MKTMKQSQVHQTHMRKESQQVTSPDTTQSSIVLRVGVMMVKVHQIKVKVHQSTTIPPVRHSLEANRLHQLMTEHLLGVRG